MALRQAAFGRDIVLSLNAHGCCNLASVSSPLVAMKAQQVEAAATLAAASSER